MGGPSDATHRRKELYELLFAGTAHGGDRRSSRNYCDMKQEEPERFTLNTANATDSRRLLLPFRRVIIRRHLPVVRLRPPGLLGKLGPGQPAAAVGLVCVAQDVCHVVLLLLMAALPRRRTLCRNTHCPAANLVGWDVLKIVIVDEDIAAGADEVVGELNVI